MYSAAIITFREILEIALILGIIMAATKGLKGRNLWVCVGLLGGVAGAVIVAFFADAIASSMEGQGQEMFNAGIMLAAVIMIGWTVMWMQKHGREISQAMKRVGKQVAEGERPLHAIAVVIALAMLREGSEIVLFLYGPIAAKTESISAILLGALAGGGCAAVLGALLYFGLVIIPLKHFFRVTSWLLILLAAGIAAQAAGFLVAGGVLPELAPEVWDSSTILAESRLPGQILHAIFGYTERPNGMQLAFYGVTLVGILGLVKLVNTQPKRQIS